MGGSGSLVKYVNNNNNNKHYYFFIVLSTRCMG